MKIVLFIIIISLIALNCHKSGSRNIASYQIKGPVEIDSSQSIRLYGKYILTLKDVLDTMYFYTYYEDSTQYYPFNFQFFNIMSKDSFEVTPVIAERTFETVSIILPKKEYEFHFRIPYMPELHKDSISFQFFYCRKPDMENSESFQVGLKTK